MPVTVNGVAELKGIEGQHVGYSDWLEISQQRVDLFADATGDHQWIHVDPERARSGPYGGTVAHGYLTLSLIPTFLPQILEMRGFSLGINYGCERVRFPAPVPVGSKLRCGAAVDSVADIEGGVQATITVTFEVEGVEKPACVASVVVRNYL